MFQGFGLVHILWSQQFHDIQGDEVEQATRIQIRFMPNCARHTCTLADASKGLKLKHPGATRLHGPAEGSGASPSLSIIVGGLS